MQRQNESNSMTVYQLYGLLSDLDEQINPLLEQRQALLRQISQVEQKLVMNARAKFFSEMIKSVASVNNPVMSLSHCNARLESWRHNLPREYFENTHEAWSSPPSNWTRAKASEFFDTLSKALEQDTAALEDLQV